MLRLELRAAFLLAKSVDKVYKDFKILLIKSVTLYTAWTNTLSWIKITKNKLQPFVQRRFSKTGELSNTSLWGLNNDQTSSFHFEGVFNVIITWLSEICWTSLIALFWNFPLMICNFPLFSHSKNIPMSTLITIIITN